MTLDMIPFADRSTSTRSLAAAGWCGLGSKCLDQRRERRGLLAPARVVEKVAGKWRAPILEHAHKCTARQVLRHAVLRDEREAHAVKSRAEHYPDIVDNQGAIHRNDQRPAALVELPPVDAAG